MLPLPSLLLSGASPSAIEITSSSSSRKQSPPPSISRNRLPPWRTTEEDQPLDLSFSELQSNRRDPPLDLSSQRLIWGFFLNLCLLVHLRFPKSKKAGVDFLIFWI
ncbi:unnamed protein product [Linum trigynum]|uniref:Uncharacterized protein n=1 Tax=Linum trigynum TaxID=586398 RepID=A0AAV2CQQ5_9ROSI